MTFNFEKRFGKVGEVISFRAKDPQGVSRTVYARILDREFKPYRGYSLGSIAAAASSAFIEITQTTTGGYYLAPNETNLVGHYFTGIYPNHCRLYWQYPIGTKVGSLRDLSQVGDAAGAMPGDWLPYNDPTSVLEFVTLKDVTTPAFAVTNDGASTVTFSLNFVGVWYVVQWLDMNKNDENVLVQKASALDLIRYIPFGGITPNSKPTWLRV